MFERLSYSEDLNLCGFAADNSNMFHNICLPAWMVSYFLLRKVRIGNLSGVAQRQQCKQLHLRQRPLQSALFRPMQRTLAMGFKWSVVVTHTLTINLIARLGAALSSTHRWNVNFRNTRHLDLREGDELSLHIIDDVNFIEFSVQDSAMKEFQTMLWHQLAATGLPVKLS